MNKLLAVAVVLAGLAALALSQSVQSYNVLSAIRVNYMPHPRDMVQIAEGTPYTVPEGRVFVLTALGARGSSSAGGPTGGGLVGFEVNGTQELHADIHAIETTGLSTNGISMKPVPQGLTAVAGSVISVTGGNPGDTTDARAWGYLAES